MNYPHRIRLRGPWEFRPLAEPVAHDFRITLPCDLSATKFASFSGPVRCLRKFGYPGTIDPDERVWLIVAGLARPSSLRLNDLDLQSSATGNVALEVTSRLSERNRLEIVAEHVPGQKQLWEDAALEIRALAYLEEMAACVKGDEVRVQGVAAGSSENPLELYVLVNGQHTSYQTLRPGTSFSLHAKLPRTPAPQPADGAVSNQAATKVRVELVHVSSIWYVWEAAIPGIS